ncbi:hypothetical protein [Acinetobacter equi]|uniref:DUF4124 domain-containing protein n=1 Tax=Acinetobacter equi TaxID=1324350 RepID=A0A0N9W1T0_9GAMM|nr:hypothetical protein [Acinetobacter equi]ALH95439.1 hypothetical protein AOY20_07765 [Acinetobacter equi]
MNFYSIKKIKIFFFFILSVHSNLVLAKTSQKTSSEIIYRYYDKNGVANISTNITANHIYYGYEALNQNMQVIQKHSAFNVEKSLLDEKSLQNAIKQKKDDARLKQAYMTSQNAIQKKKQL